MVALGAYLPCGNRTHTGDPAAKPRALEAIEGATSVGCRILQAEQLTPEEW
jgi:hypothetical protein